MLLNSIDSYMAEMTKKRIVHYYPNPGNAGDALIALATFQIFKRNQVNYRWIDLNHFVPQGQTVIYSGGGNLTRYYRYAHDFISTIHHEVEKLIILPHTIEGHEQLLAKLGHNVEIICRERTSYKHVLRYAKKANVYLSDDMAFHLDIDHVFANAQFRRAWHRSLDLTMLIRAVYKRSFDQLSSYLHARLMIRRTGILNAFRRDAERSEIKIPNDNCDVSEVTNHGTYNELALFSSAIHLLRLVSSCRQLRTNRLHVAIAGALLGKEVLFYPNSYYKNQAVYEFSMKSRFPNVRRMST